MISTVAVGIQANVPLIIWGDPGTGKTASIQAMAGVLEWPLEIIIASIREPSDFSGLPVVSDDGVHLVSPAWAIRMADEPHGIIFFDELSCAPPANQAALLRVVNERWVGETKLGPGIAIIACSNPPETAAGGWDLPPAQANRFCHLRWSMDEKMKDKWVRGWLQGFPRTAVPRLPKDWEGIIPDQVGILAAFLRTRPHLILQVPESENLRGGAWPSPRTWDMAARLGAAARSVSDKTSEHLLMLGCVGAGPTIEFMEWRDKLDLPDPEVLLADPTKYKHPSRGDRAFAILASVIAAYLRKSTQERFDASWVVLERATKGGGADIAAVHAQTLLGAKEKMDLATALKSSKALAPLLRAAGMIL